MSITVEAPRLEYGGDGGSVPVARPRVSWISHTSSPDWRQMAAELRLSSDGDEETVRLDGDASVLVDWPFVDLAPGQRGKVQVRVLDEQGWSDWSRATAFSASFLAEDEWRARFVGLSEPDRHAHPVQLRHEFDVAKRLERATWYATAHGAYQAWVNGVEVDDQVLKPGWTPYQFRLIHETTDVTTHLSQGRNAIAVALAGGWFTESFGFQGQAQPFYGTQPAFAGQLRLDYADGDTEWIVTSEQWQASADGPWLAAGIYGGEDYDARRASLDWAHPGFSALGWEQAVLREAGPVPAPRTSPGVRVTQEVSVEQVLTSPSGKTLLDFGQNLVGRLRIRVDGEAGQTITLRHAEVLEDGELGVRPLRMASATDHYTLDGTGEQTWAPRFTFHGFRYAEVTGWPGVLDPSAIVAEVLGSDMRRTGWFKCSEPLVNKLHDNVVWGMRGNFLYLPTDCPQRDERLGWTGDIQIFGPTASFLYDCDGFLASWLVDLALEQKAAGGSVAFTVPDVLHSGRVPAAAWGDAATVVPWVLYERYADRAVLQEQYPSMKAWVDTLEELAGDRHLWEGGFQFGDWVDPDSPADDPAKAKTDPDLVASAFFFRSATLLARTAALLGHTEDATRYDHLAHQVREAWLAEYVTSAGRIVSDAQTAYAVAIQFDIATGDLRQRLAERLAGLVRRDGYRISTGFVGTPLVTDALSSTGHLHHAARMLLQTECPSWLYSVTMGATTIWERWDSLLEDGSINPGEMTSFNHYALGSVADWLHRVVAGLAPAEPGYRRVRVAPLPLPGLEWARARHDGPYGRIEVSWRRTGETVEVQATIPANSSAVVELPGIETLEVGSGTHQWQFPAPAPVPPPEPVNMDTALSSIIDDPEAYAAILRAFEQVSPEVALDFRRRTRWLPNQRLFSTFSLVSPRVTRAVADSLTKLNAARGFSTDV